MDGKEFSFVQLALRSRGAFALFNRELPKLHHFGNPTENRAIARNPARRRFDTIDKRILLGREPGAGHRPRQRHRNGEAKMGQLTGQVAIVTGASRGIGRAIAMRLARDGAAVAIGYCPDDGPDEATTVVAAIEMTGGRAAAVPADVTREAEVARLFGATQQVLGPIDIVVNNAGGGPGGALAEATLADFDLIYALNVKSVLFSTKLAARHLNDGGRIVNVASITAVEPAPGLGVYASSKAAVCSLTQVAAMELGERGIRVNAVLPGLIATTLTRDVPPEIWERALSRTTLGRHGLPEDVAGVACFLAGPDSGWMTGQLVRVHGGTPG